MGSSLTVHIPTGSIFGALILTAFHNNKTFCRSHTAFIKGKDNLVKTLSNSIRGLDLMTRSKVCSHDW